MLRKLHTALSWLLVALFTVIGFVFFRILNRTTVIGLESVLPYLKKNGVIIATNHRSMLDSIFATTAMYCPWVLRPSRFDRLPYHAAASENYFRWYNGWFYSHVRSLRVKSGRHDTSILLKMTRLLRERKSVYLFPQGGRGRSDEIIFRSNGVGCLVRKTGADVIVGRLWGMEQILPIGKSLPRIGKRITLVVSGPVDLSSFLGLPDDSSTWKAITERIRQEVVSLESN